MTNEVESNEEDTLSDERREESENEVPTQVKQSRVCAPYIQGASERTARILQKYNVQLCHKPTRTLRGDICNMKDKRPPMD